MGKVSTLGRYEILAELGRGNMGIVYKAYDPKINRHVAIKTIALAVPESSAEPSSRADFIREAEAAGRLSHPRIVAVFDVGEDPATSNPYIVMEYVAGKSLEEILADQRRKLPPQTAVHFVQEVAEALDYAHLQGVVHRDVKPSNILVAEDGHVKVADFGIAQLKAGAAAGTNWGTPAYMSPEQLRGEPLDGRSDLFSLGVVLYTLLTGHRPFQGYTSQTISVKTLTRDPVPASALGAGLTPEVDRVIARALAKNPAERYQTGSEMVRELQRLREQLESSKDSVPRQKSEPDHTQDLFPRYPLSGTGSVARPEKSASSSDRASIKISGPPFTRPWQQLAIAFLTFGILAFTFAGLWRAIPVKAGQTSVPLASKGGRVAPAEKSDTGSSATQFTTASKIELPASGVPARRVKAAISHHRVTQDNLQYCQLRLAVEHHFVTANLSVWIDDQPSYSHSLRGAVKKRVVLFKEVKGYLFDSVKVAAGVHRIRVQVLSADGSYDESGMITANFVTGNDKMLLVGFDNNNQRMHLSFETQNQF